MAHNNTPKKKSGFLFYFLLFICMAVLAFAVYNLARIFMEYGAGTIEYDNLRKYTETVEAPQNNNASAASTSDSDSSALQVPIEINFSALQDINRDIVGWIYIGSAEISYPIVQGDDDNEYLYTTFEKQSNSAGSIFLEAKNSGDFSNAHSIVYGHNMRNGSMFGKLHRLKEESVITTDPYFWILTPDGDYCYRIFSIHSTPVDSAVYTLFDGVGDSFVDWSLARQAESDINLGQFEFSTGSKVVTLSTCTGDSSTRLVVHGVRVMK